MSNPFASFGYVLVFAPGAGGRTLEDLRDKRIAVQLGSPPQTAVALRGDIEPLTVRSPEEGIRTLLDGRAEGAWLWGPSVGYALQEAGEAAAGTGHRTGKPRVEPGPPGPGMQWPVAVGVRRDHARLKQAVDRALDRIAGELPALAARYGIAVTAAPNPALAASPSASRPARGRTAVTVPAQAFFAVNGEATAGAGGAGGDTEAGRVIFNTHCSHCHGPNAESPDQRIDLRRLSRRYRDDKDAVFATTVHEGRPDKGMPAWKGVIAEAEIAKVKAYVDSVQARK
jgi:polar amino acid transport system substrate-binding protein